MKKDRKISNKLIVGLILVIVGMVVIGVVSILFNTNNKKSSLDTLKSSVEKVFFYLPDDKYDNMNDIPDYCKISMVFGSNYLKYDKLLSKKDYITEVSKKSNNTTEAYKKSSVISAVQSVLGSNSTINFNKNDEGLYDFLMENNCKLENDSIDTLSYNSQSNYLYSIDNDEEASSAELYVKWGEAESNGDNLIFYPQALVTLKTADGGYNVYADNNFNSVVGTIGSEDDIKSKIEDLYINSKNYVITFKKQGDNYIWANYEIVNDAANDKSIVCE